MPSGNGHPLLLGQPQGRAVGDGEVWSQSGRRWWQPPPFSDAPPSPVVPKLALDLPVRPPEVHEAASRAIAPTRRRAPAAADRPHQPFEGSQRRERRLGLGAGAHALRQVPCEHLPRVARPWGVARRRRGRVVDALLMDGAAGSLAAPEANVEAAVGPAEGALAAGAAALPAAIVAVAIGPDERAPAVDEPRAPAAGVLGAVAPGVAPAAVGEPRAPLAVVAVTVGVALLAGAVLEVLSPDAAVGVPRGANVGAGAVHEAVEELALVGGARGPGEPAAAGGLAPAPLALVHAAVRPEVLAGAVGNGAAPLARVDVAVGERPLVRVGFVGGAAAAAGGRRVGLGVLATRGRRHR